MPLLLLQLPGLPSRNAHSLHLLFGLFGPSKFIPFMYQAATCSGLFSDPLLNHQETVCEKELTYSTHAVLDPVSGALVHNCGSVIVIVNSALLLRWAAKG